LGFVCVDAARREELLSKWPRLLEFSAHLLEAQWQPEEDEIERLSFFFIRISAALRFLLRRRRQFCI